MARQIACVAAEADLFQKLVGARFAFGLLDACVQQRQGDVIEQHCARQQIETLKHESDKSIAKPRELIAGELRGVVAVQQIASLRGRVEAAENVHEGRFARARRTHDRDELALMNDHTDVFEHWLRTGIGRVLFVQMLDAYNLRHTAGRSHYNGLMRNGDCVPPPVL